MTEERGSGRNLIRVLQQPILFGSLAFGFLSFALPIYGKNLGASALEIGGLFAIVSLVLVLARPIVGWALDRIGRKVFFVAALVCFTASMGLFALVDSITGLYIAQFVRGLGGAMMWISAYTIATDLSGSDQRGKAVGHVDEARARGSLFGGIAGFVLFSQLPVDIGWQVIFAGYALFAAVGAWLGWKQVPETRPLQPTDGEPDRAISNRLYRLLAQTSADRPVRSKLAPVNMPPRLPSPRI